MTPPAPPALRPYDPRSVLADWSNRLVRCVFGLALCGTAIALILHAELGAAPWDMLHKGISEHLGVSVGLVIEVVGFALLLLWIPLHQRVGVGTVLNAIVIGLVLDLVAPHLPETTSPILRVTFLLAGVMMFAIGSGFYIGAGLGAGPRDGLMVGISRRGPSVRVARTVIEITVGIGGVLLGQWPGIGTIIFMFAIGPLVQMCLQRLALPPRQGRSRKVAQPAVLSTGTARS